jgi:hypothetical protein
VSRVLAVASFGSWEQGLLARVNGGTVAAYDARHPRLDNAVVIGGLNEIRLPRKRGDG